MVKTILISIGASIVTATIFGVIIKERGDIVVKALEEENNKINKKLDEINRQTTYLSKKWIVEEINRNTRPVECKLENLNIDIRTPSINGVNLFKITPEDAANKVPCVKSENRKIVLLSPGEIPSFVTRQVGYDGESVYFIKINKEEKSFAIIGKGDTAKSLPIAGLGFNWQKPELLKGKLGNQVHENYSKENKIRKAAYSMEYGCMVVNYYYDDNIDIFPYRLSMKNQSCTNSDVAIKDSDKYSNI